ncbi:MAG: type VI secretion system tip protein VgrG [Myxococcales bacterium]|nr:type VI secretion system tip protein VgrG [Myxococcales bacterium]
MTHDYDPPEPPDPDHPEAPEEGEHGPEDSPLETTEGAVDTAGKIVGAISKGVDGDGFGAAGGALGAAGGVLETIAGAVDDEEVREGLEAAGTVVEVAEKVLEASHEIGEMAGHGGHGAGGHGVPGAGGHGAPSTPTSDVGRYTTEDIFGRDDDRFHADDVFGDDDRFHTDDIFGTSSQNVRYTLEVDGSDVEFAVRSVQFQDGVMGLPTCLVSATCAAHALAGEPDVFGKEVTVTIHRGNDLRQFKGLVRRGNVTDENDHQVVDIDIVPGLWLLSQNQDSRVFQDVTVPGLVTLLFKEQLDSRGRKVRLELTQSYPEHEYLVQYRESEYALIRRLCDEEGIWFYFDHSGDEGREVLVLCDSNDNRPRISGGSNGRIQYSEHESAQQMEECAFHFERARWIGPTDAVQSDYDWTNPPLTVRHEATGLGETEGPSLEIHEHRSAARFHGYGDRQYDEHTAQRYTTHAAERLRLARHFWTCSTSVVGVEPGHVMELVGANDDDGRYLVLTVSVTGQTGQAAGGFHANLELIPIDFPYRPPAPQRPVVQGPETATVTGPSGEEIHCDLHGRVKVHFHWDRRSQRDDKSSVWIRVAQFWAGPGWGSMFIPRIGTEVIVSFLGGDPDRPVITGRLYNGNHPVPYTLPDHKTRSTIKTQSTPNASGFNELRFEDKAGDEEVFIHAEKDFNEEVKHCHSTHVGMDQSNTVDHDQTELVKANQTLTVRLKRSKTVEKEETNVIKKTRLTTIGEDDGDEVLTVHGERSEEILGAKDELTVESGDKLTHVLTGKWDIDTKGPYYVRQNDDTELRLDDRIYGGTTGPILLMAGAGTVTYDAKDSGELHIQSTGAQRIESTDGNMLLITPQKIKLSADTEITLQCGSSTIKLTPSGIEISGGQVTVSSTSGNTTVDAAGQVKVKC